MCRCPILAENIRLLMDSLLKLAKVFDGQPSATYAANIMTFIPTSGKYPCLKRRSGASAFWIYR